MLFATAQGLDIPDFTRPPNLSVDGSNWYIYNIRMTLFLQARGVYHHVESDVDPPDPCSFPSQHLEFKQREDTAKLIIASTLPDSVLLLIHDRPTAKGMWSRLAQEFEPKTVIFKAGLEKAFRDSGSEAQMAQLRERLAGAGRTVSHDDYFRQRVQLLDGDHYPLDYKDARRKFIADSMKDPVANWVSDKYSLDTSIVSVCNVRLSDSGEQTGRDAHLTSDRNSEGGSARTVLVTPSADRAIRADESSCDRGAEIQPPSRVSREVLRTALAAGAPSSVSPATSLAAIPQVESPDIRHEVYSTDVPHHISPYRSDFVTFTSMKPKTFISALGSTLIATGIGDLPIFVPDGHDEKPTLLKNAYYAPKLTATLVSLSQLSQEWEGVGDLSIDADGGTLAVTNDEGVFASIPMRDGLHQVTHQVSLDRIAHSKRMAFAFRPFE
ncbi:hypothetical protein BOTBODRAFT_36621 [Botryobasidium botryosum FD-172 SS1]|uniref:Retrovirus-related Pol polyprotein from transposon TNT 1-94-like beta-barrel domain-containing protein n=1 Tax=Botryobasidium botryosum (strain FD-172 SS1) TaxID=930990 RepID=A0A067MDP1_BOTB1|nr:hypothetical protein BOTBODRAFT_36621 [Botryobasidium botryosum FD-172 SS1]